MPVDIISIHIKEALNDLGEITGKNVSQNIIDEIFSKFCLGKQKKVDEISKQTYKTKTLLDQRKLEMKFWIFFEKQEKIKTWNLK